MHDLIEQGIGSVLVVYSRWATIAQSLYISRLIQLYTYSPGTTEALRSDLESQVASFKEEIAAATDRLMDEIWGTRINQLWELNEAFSLSQPSVDAWAALLSEIEASVLSQLDRDVRTLRAQFSRFQMRVQLRQTSEGIMFQNALLSERESEIRSLGLDFKDRAGRKWKSNVALYVMLHQASYELANLVFLDYLAQMGAESVLLRDREGTEKRVSFEQWRDFAAERIHPRSKLLVVLE